MADEADDEALIEHITRDIQTMRRAGEIPPPLPGRRYGALSHTAFWRPNWPVEIARRVIDDAVRVTSRALRERRLLTTQPPWLPSPSEQQQARTRHPK